MFKDGTLAETFILQRTLCVFNKVIDINLPLLIAGAIWQFNYIHYLVFLPKYFHIVSIYIKFLVIVKQFWIYVSEAYAASILDFGLAILDEFRPEGAGLVPKIPNLKSKI